MKPTPVEATIARTFDVALNGVRHLLGREALLGVARSGIAHLAESLRRAGLGADARAILIAELGDLDLATASAAALERRAGASGAQHTVNAHTVNARGASVRGVSVRVIDGGRRS